MRWKRRHPFGRWFAWHPVWLYDERQYAWLVFVYRYTGAPGGGWLHYAKSRRVGL